MELDHQDAARIWNVAAGRLKECNANLFEQWFRLLLPLELRDGKLKLGVSDDFFASIIVDEYDDLSACRAGKHRRRQLRLRPRGRA